MVVKERLLEQSGIDPGQYGEAINNLARQNTTCQRAMTEAENRLQHLIAELEAVLDGQQERIRPFPD